MSELGQFFGFLSRSSNLFNLEPIHLFFRPALDSKALASALKSAKSPAAADLLLLYAQHFPELEMVNSPEAGVRRKPLDNQKVPGENRNQYRILQSRLNRSSA